MTGTTTKKGRVFAPDLMTDATKCTVPQPLIEPCGNADCDKCDPRSRWKISRHRIQHLTHERELKAASKDEALALYEAGTAWPSTYDDREGPIVQLEPIEIERLPPDEYALTQCCWHDLPVQSSTAMANEQEVKRGANTLVEERDAFRAMLIDLLASAYPHPVEHPAMSMAWARAQALLQEHPGSTRPDELKAEVTR